MSAPIRVAVVAGEESGDLLAADAVRALRQASGREVELVGVGGRHLREIGLAPLFDASEIALMGFTAVLGKLPRLLRRIRETARAVADAAPDLLLTVDSPDFSLRVASKVRALRPSIPVAHYVCPSVWAWRPGRAAAMRPHVDHVLCLLPFEPAELERLGGPPGTFVGHRLTRDPGVLAAAKAQAGQRQPSSGRQGTLLVLPGSRRSEVQGLLSPFRETLSILRARGNRLDVLLPTVPHVAGLVSAAVESWEQKPQIIADPDGKWRAFGVADAALIASGTVSLELALSGVPMVSCYPLDPLAKLARPFITAWSASLPNLIADRAVVPEYYDPYIRPPALARVLEGLIRDGAARQAQKEGFAAVRSALATPRPAGAIAADVLLRMIRK